MLYIGKIVLDEEGMERKITNIYFGEFKEIVYELDDKYLKYRNQFDIIEE